MINNKLKTLAENLPSTLPVVVKMDRINQPISIYSGLFTIKNTNKTHTLNQELLIEGNIRYEWLPNPRITYKGIILADKSKMSFFPMYDGIDEIYINGIKFCTGVRILSQSGTHPTIIGEAQGRVTKGNHAIAVSKIKFSIPNLYEIYGLGTKHIRREKLSVRYNRLVLSHQNHTIIIDQRYDYKRIEETLKRTGGYALLHNAELHLHDQLISHQEITKHYGILHGLSVFLSFLNGNHTAPCFIRGINKRKTIWTDYRNYFVADYKNTHRCIPGKTIEGLDKLYVNFCNLWAKDPDFLDYAIHWYIEANLGGGNFIETSIVLIYNALELISNWYIQNYPTIRSAQRRTADKIRNVLRHIGLNCNVPKELIHLNNYVNDTSNGIEDAPHAFTELRNAYVHSEETRRKQLQIINSRVQYEILQLSIWYTELFLLYILGYNGRYNNIMATMEDNYVPWASTNS